MTRHSYTIDEIKHMLIDRLEAVVAQYAPPAEGSHEAFGKYYTLNPGRVDRRVGSFVITMNGSRRGYWRDFAMGDTGHGDVLDLIKLALQCDNSGALREARAFLGLSTQNPADIARNTEAAARAKAARERAAAADKLKAERRSKAAQGIWLSGKAQLRGTPVEAYLRDARGIDLATLGRQPGALRYLPQCQYYDEDPETGEVVELELPAMGALICDWKGNAVALHRTYLAPDADGRWGKAPVRVAKKVLGNYAGAAINIWRGIGPRGGKPASLPACPPGSHVMIAEGIEDALSCVMLLPAARVIAAISLANLGSVRLPENVRTVTLVADLDDNDTARAQLDRAIAQHQKAGRSVRIFQNSWGGKDLNDALRAMRGEAEEDGDQDGD